ncbi:hypothetical protein N7532_011655 [Penicillium argentinense]|uniref:Uncharacterized protein n=1 Tax=Penicillium argentinense TaxID=1131581 RepID=A0A9W9EIW9_9EURO|nr:uncharacterized protein N7532_011655 [Penicillium argentinense]KAJ5082612.1 hypothetical protein N7532_011655 [Penicillium argentinense]
MKKGGYWSFILAGSSLTHRIASQQCQNAEETSYEPIANTSTSNLIGIIGAIFALFSTQFPLIGRKWSLLTSATLQGFSMAMYTQVKNTADYVCLNALEHIMQTYFDAVLYASAPEIINTTYRASASGMFSCLGRITGITLWRP